MVVQKLEIDEFEATEIIRLNKKNTDLHQLIVTMTAQSIQGDRDRQVQAGINGGVTELFQAMEIFDLID